MYIRPMFFSVVIALIAGGCGKRMSPAEKQLVGKWYNIGKDYSFNIELRADGTFTQSLPGRESDSQEDTWRVDGANLVVALKQPDGHMSEDRGSYVQDGNQLKWMRPGGPEMTFTRIK